MNQRAHSLQETIENFQAFILKHEHLIDSDIYAKDEIFRAERLDVYFQAYSLRLIEAISKTFPMVQKLAGDELFETLSREYVHHYPSNHFSVRFFGRHFSKFLSTHPQAQPIWVEMAAFEWEVMDVIDAPDAPLLTFDNLATLSPEAWSELTLKLHPSLITLPLYFPVPALWRAIHFNTEHPALDRLEQPITWMIWRQNLRASFLSVTPEQLVMLQAIQNGDTFSEVCAKLCEFLSEEQVVTFAAQTLRQWINEGIFSEYQIKAAE
jgi:hypothetical protein